jgi:hypothetical protein
MRVEEDQSTPHIKKELKCKMLSEDAYYGKIKHGRRMGGVI